MTPELKEVMNIITKKESGRKYKDITKKQEEGNTRQ